VRFATRQFWGGALIGSIVYQRASRYGLLQELTYEISTDEILAAVL
jgi:hypothetical protein